MTERLTGAIKWYDPIKGYGFVTTDKGGDIFLHHSDLAMHDKTKLYPGDRVSYEISQMERGDKAINVDRD